MGKVCPHCKGKDFHLQTPAVFHFDGDDFVGDELLCDITENLCMADFDESYLVCSICDWDGKVRDLIDPVVPQPKLVQDLEALPREKLVEHIRELENRLHGIENAVDGYDGNAHMDPPEYIAELEGIFEIVKGYCPWDDSNEYDSWLINPRCPKCGWALHQCDSGEQGCLHCDNQECSYTNRGHGSTGAK